MLKSNNDPILLLHPITISSFNVCASIMVMKELIGQRIFIVTKNKQMVNALLPSAIPDDLYGDYNDQQRINQFIQYNNGYLLIDDASLLHLSGLNFVSTLSNLKIIIIASFGLTEPDLTYLKSQFKTIQYLSINLFDYGPSLEYILHSLSNSNKITLLLTIILSKLGDRHLIYGQNHDILENLLSEMKIKYAYADEPKINENIPVILTRNSLINCLPNIGHIHFIDPIDYFEYKAFVDIIYKKKNYTMPCSILRIHFYLLLNQSDIDSYTQLSQRLQNEQSVFSSIMDKTQPWIIN